MTISAEANVPARPIDRRLAVLVVMAGIVPCVWFPWQWPVVAAASLPIIPLAPVVCWVASGKAYRRTGLELPLLLMVLAACVAAIPVADWSTALPKALGIAFGASLTLVLARVVDSPAAVGRLTLVVALLALAVAGVGLLGATEGGGKIPGIERMSSILPPLLHRVPLVPRYEVNSNEVAGVLVLLIPILIAQVGTLVGSSVNEHWAEAGGRDNRGPWLLGTSAVTAAAVLAGTIGVLALILSQSRGGYIAVAVEMIALAMTGVVRSVRRLGVPRLVSLVAVLAVLTMAAAVAWGMWRLIALRELSGGATDVTYTLRVRLALWHTTVAMIEDYALTGVGLGQYGRVLGESYPTFGLPEGMTVPHAHNLFLQYAVELGVPGGLAFLFLLGRALYACARGTASGDPQVAWTAYGVGMGILGFLTYGLVDAISPGARGGLPLWLVLGLAGSLGRLGGVPASRRSKPRPAAAGS